MIYSSVWVAAGIASLVILVQNTMGLEQDWRPIMLIFFAALAFYNLDRIADSFLQPSPDSRAQAFFHQGWGWLFLVVAAGMALTLLLQSNRAVQYLSLVGLVPILYGVPTFPWRQGRRLNWLRLKDLPGSKAWIVAGISAYSLVTIPLAYAEVPISGSLTPTFLFLLLFLAVNVILFDIRDIESDRQAGVLTVPVLIGVRGARQFCLVLTWLAWLLVGWGSLQGIVTPRPEIVLPWLMATSIVLSLARRDTPRGWYDIWVDGSLFIPALTIGITQIIPVL